jgi:hypothetical protein
LMTIVSYHHFPSRDIKKSKKARGFWGSLHGFHGKKSIFRILILGLTKKSFFFDRFENFLTPTFEDREFLINRLFGAIPLLL